MSVGQRKGSAVVVDEDEEFKKIDYAKVPLLKSAFRRDAGTVTAANSSTLNDGASAVLLMSLSEATRCDIEPLAEILSYADAETDPKEFTIAPSLAIPMALERAGLTKDQVDLWEINEAFSVVVLANQKVRLISIILDIGFGPEQDQYSRWGSVHGASDRIIRE